ncbi:MAG: beta-ketoacyl synthase N-terminal-like domain-containing protein [Pseudomonadota bacterium]
MDKFYVTASSASAFPATEPASDIKALLRDEWGARPRRTSRLTDLSLLGALRCTQGQINPDKMMGLYLASGRGSVGDTSGMLQQILVQDVEPMPLTFINVSSNMPGYYISQNLGLTGPNLAVTAGKGSFDSAVELALLDLNSGAVEQALIGAVEECAYPLSEYRAHLALSATVPLAESSAWMMLSRRAEGSLAELRLCRHYSRLDNAIEALGKLPQATRYVVAGELPAQLQPVLDERNISPLEGVFPGDSQSIAAWQLLQALEQSGDESLLYLRGNREEGVFVMWLCR